MCYFSIAPFDLIVLPLSQASVYFSLFLRKSIIKILIDTFKTMIIIRVKKLWIMTDNKNKWS